ncbi:MAG: hypothetical protein ABEI52_06490, partial [Halobacteriaceae archaeon]
LSLDSNGGTEMLFNRHHPQFPDGEAFLVDYVRRVYDFQVVHVHFGHTKCDKSSYDEDAVIKSENGSIVMLRRFCNPDYPVQKYFSITFKHIPPKPDPFQENVSRSIEDAMKSGLRVLVTGTLYGGRDCVIVAKSLSQTLTDVRSDAIAFATYDSTFMLETEPRAFEVLHYLLIPDTYRPDARVPSKPRYFSYQKLNIPFPDTLQPGHLYRLEDRSNVLYFTRKSFEDLEKEVEASFFTKKALPGVVPTPEPTDVVTNLVSNALSRAAAERNNKTSFQNLMRILENQPYKEKRKEITRTLVDAIHRGKAPHARDAEHFTTFRRDLKEHGKNFVHYYDAWTSYIDYPRNEVPTETWIDNKPILKRSESGFDDVEPFVTRFLIASNIPVVHIELCDGNSNTDFIRKYDPRSRSDGIRTVALTRRVCRPRPSKLLFDFYENVAVSIYDAWYFNKRVLVTAASSRGKDCVEIVRRCQEIWPGSLPPKENLMFVTYGSFSIRDLPPSKNVLHYVDVDDHEAKNANNLYNVRASGFSREIRVYYVNTLRSDDSKNWDAKKRKKYFRNEGYTSVQESVNRGFITSSFQGPSIWTPLGNNVRMSNYEQDKYNKALEILGINQKDFSPLSLQQKLQKISLMYKRKAIQVHPDKEGGSDEKMKELNNANDFLKQFVESTG